MKRRPHIPEEHREHYHASGFTTIGGEPAPTEKPKAARKPAAKPATGKKAAKK